jgi:hypothetical protein
MHSDHSALDNAEPSSTALELEATRLAFVTARIRALEDLELELLERAVNAPDDEAGCRLEFEADAAWRDVVALSSEHEPVHNCWPEGDAL